MLKRRLTEPFGKAGLTVAVVALVMALVGGAYAAGGLTKAQEKQVTKIAKKYAGKPGAPGTAGANGTTGTNGKDGAPGADGQNGADGVSVTSTESANAIEGHCNGTTNGGKGGSKFVSASGTTYACNGKEGSPWTAGGTLPVGSTETGTWAFSASSADQVEVPFIGEVVPVPVSFAIPLAASLGESNVHYYTESGFSSTCTGSGPAPTAPSGQLCVYGGGLGEDINATFSAIVRAGEFEFGASKSGAILLFKEVEDGAGAWGTFAVTG